MGSLYLSLTNKSFNLLTERNLPMRNDTLRKILSKKLEKLQEKIAPALLEIELVNQQLDLLDKHEENAAMKKAAADNEREMFGRVA